MTRAAWRYVWAFPNSALGLLLSVSAIRVADGVRIVDGILEAHSPLIAFLLRRCTLLRGGAAAITLGHVVLGRSADALRVSRRHEQVHVRQYEQWGPFFIPAYFAASLWAFMTGEGAYEGNWFEREAWRCERSPQRMDFRR